MQTQSVSLLSLVTAAGKMTTGGERRGDRKWTEWRRDGDKEKPGTNMNHF